MVKPSFSLRVKYQKSSKHWERRKNLAHTSVAQDHINRRNQQLDAAVKWCRENSKRGWAALKTGLFDLIKDPRTINSRLDGNVETGAEREYCSVLTSQEEESLVRFVKNRNRAYQAMNRKQITDLAIQILKVRKYTNRTFRGRKGVPLSENAKNALQKNSLGKGFWKRFDTKYSTLTHKRQSSVSVNRALNCTREMAIYHLDELAKELITLGIFTDAKQNGPGKWRGKIDTSRIFNHDETPQFVNYDDERNSGLVYCGKGDECKKMIHDNRECVTIHPFISLSGEMIMCHIIFKGQTITSQMASCEEIVNKLDNLLISTTENGVQNHESLLDSYIQFNDILETNKVQKPVSVMSDGHSSRFDPDVLSFMEDNQNLFIGPPDTTGVTQTLDQMNQNLHKHYKNYKDNIFSTNGAINRDGFMQILSEIWNKWAPRKSIIDC